MTGTLTDPKGTEIEALILDWIHAATYVINDVSGNIGNDLDALRQRVYRRCSDLGILFTLPMHEALNA